MESHFATIWESVADAVPDAPALVQGEVRRTWAEFDERASRVAGVLAEAGLRAGAKVGILLFNSPEYLEVQFAALKLRAVPINVNYRYVADELVYLLDNADAEALIFHSSLGDRVAQILPRLSSLRLALEVVDRVTGSDGSGTSDGDRVGSYEDAIAAATPAPRVTRSADDVTMTYTGGTTGMPKGVVGRIGPVIDGLLVSVPMLLGMSPVTDPAGAAPVAKAVYDEGRQYVSLPACPLMHATAMGIGALPPLLFGSCVVLLGGHRFDVDELWATVERERVSGITIVGDPFARPMLRGLTDGPERTLDSVRFVLSSGAMFSVEVKSGLLEFLPGALILDFIASTEGAMGVSISSRGAVAPTGTFRPGPGVVVLSDDDRIIEPGSGETGLVAIGGVGAEAYFKDPEKSAGTFRVVDGVRYTIPGDHAILAADGSIELLGRGSQSINTGGEKVFPEEVEEAIKAVPGIDDCLVFGQPDERFGQRVVGVASRSAGPGEGISVATALEAAGEHLAAYKLPRQLIFVDIVPRIATGKADYPAARRLFDEAAAAG